MIIIKGIIIYDVERHVMSLIQGAEEVVNLTGTNSSQNSKTET